MWCRLIIDGNAVYEIDEECVKEKRREGGRKRQRGEGKTGKNTKESRRL